ncbi:hypothetical protein MHM88_14530 [Epibacterium sp. MM17-32]|uniref:hypothetical protein n=1 Tax=Epibacterium sp. MM17-32 TaxID=2917734 RepID=UPI001EF42ECD|nr:hypothetical protein [Epibacterium sp. MM17-32]MCG7629024.1 hypothetical protein [Epibacterium sp. MM17-32]
MTKNRQPLPLDVSFYVEIFIDNRILGGMAEDQVDRFIELLHEEGATETCHYGGITVSFDHGCEQTARNTVQRALDRLNRGHDATP